MALPMVPIYTQTVGAGGASSIIFNNIPQVYTDLKLEVSARCTGTDPQIILIQFNGTSTNYSSTRLGGNGGGAFSDNSNTFSQTSWLFENMNIVPDSGTTNTFASVGVYVPNYTSSNFKSAIGDSVSESNVATYSSPTWAIGLYLEAGLWRNTAAISRIDITPSNSKLWMQHSTFSLYGILRAGA